jgi:BirA family biotin operon repressor/biotin-[acetyl-CoA-carboxylase] ligase
VNFTIIRFDTCSSTNDVARDLARGGAPAGTVVVADEQTAGRGTKGRSWISLRGKGLYVSVIVRPLVPEISLLPLAAGLAACDAVEIACGLAPALRWPNDIVWEGRKLGGILCESAFWGNRPDYAILGTGLNADHTEEDFPADLRPAAVSIRIASGTRPDREALLAALLVQTDRRVETVERSGGAEILRDFESRSAFRPGDPIAILVGDAVVRGEYRGLDAEGALLLGGSGTVRCFAVAEIVKVL